MGFTHYIRVVKHVKKIGYLLPVLLMLGVVLPSCCPRYDCDFPRFWTAMPVQFAMGTDSAAFKPADLDTIQVVHQYGFSGMSNTIRYFYRNGNFEDTDGNTQSFIFISHSTGDTVSITTANGKHFVIDKSYSLQEQKRNEFGCNKGCPQLVSFAIRLNGADYELKRDYDNVLSPARISGGVVVLKNKP